MDLLLAERDGDLSTVDNDGQPILSQPLIVPLLLERVGFAFIDGRVLW